jgi:flagellar secretion chaperone FliS
MSMTAVNVQSEYQKTMVATAGRARLVVLLYQGLLRFTHLAIEALERGDHAEAHTSLLRAQDIVVELASSLDLTAGGQIAQNLLQLYDYGYRQLVQANCQKDPVPAQDASRIFGELLAVWSEVAARSTDHSSGELPRRYLEGD